MNPRDAAQLHVILFDVSEHYLPDDRIFAPLLRLWRSAWDEDSYPGVQFSSDTLEPWLGYVALLRQEDHGEDFVYRLFGERLSDEYDLDMTGRRLSELPFGLGSILLAATSAAVEKQIPVFVIYKPGPDNVFGDRADLILPMSAPGEVIVASYPMAFSTVGEEKGSVRAMLNA